MGRVFFNTRKNMVNLAAAYTVLASDSGTVFTINQASAYEITLPLMSTIEDGWNCEFIISTADTNNVTIANHTDEDTIVGMVSYSDTDTSNAAAATAETAVDEIVFISGAQLGDTVRIVANGANYFATAQAHDAAHITIS